uniref:HTH OST-type domain-containing protein n=1 Tax=Davidia involucrata TaxID=16924 RepID=A0A5B7B662_DAVIN
MKRLFPRTIFIFSSRSLSINPINNVEIHQHRHGLRISHFSTSSNSFHSSQYSSHPSRRHEEESRNVRVSVWWDFENCTLPAGTNVFKVAQSITAAIRANGIKGPIQITAFGDVLQLSRSNQEALSSTGISLTHIPNGGKNSADRSLLVDLMYWVSQNPPPAHLFLISGDRDFASILHRLRMNNYNILLASPETTPGVLCSAASIMWHWNALVKGENLTGKHFNQPPDGPYGSWYGHYRAPLEDPFAVTGQPACSAEELSEFGSNTKLRPVSKAVVKQIRHILNVYPKGISITELRTELGKSNVSIDKDLYGYKKFSRFLLSMPHILKLQSGGDGQFFVCSIAPKVPEPVESTPGMSTGPVTNNGDSDFLITPKLNGEDSSSTKVVDEKSSLPPSPEFNVKEPPKKLQEPGRKVQEPPPLVEKVNNADVTESHLHPVEEHDSVSEVGFFKRIWRKWFGGIDGGSGKKSCSIPEKSSTSHGSTESTRTEDNCVKTSQSADPVSRASFCSSSNEAVTDDKTVGSSEAHGDKSSKGSGFFSQIMSWSKFWRGQNSDYSNEQSSEKSNQITIDSGKHEIVLKESFWNDVEAFIDTPNCSVLVSQSRTRKQMGQHLQKQGPLVLSSLNESDLLHLVDLLISEKKWVVECPSQTYPFKVILPAGKSSTFSNHCSSNGLRSIFLNKPMPQRLPEHSGEKRHQNVTFTGISPPVISKKPSGKTRSKILADCQKLVHDIVKEYPEGFNIGLFRKLFLERYGYSLDVQELGYQKLATFLQIMPGVKIESTYMIPSGKFSKNSIVEVADPNVQENNTSVRVANSDSELSDSSRRDDDLDSPWEELGPVANTSPKGNEIELGLSRKLKQTGGQMHHDYETLSDDYISDSEEETSSSAGSVGQGKPRVNEADGSLLQILDSWYSSKEENNRWDGSQNVDGMVDCSQNVIKPSGSSGIGIKTETPEVNYERKPKPFKSYSFVSDQPGNKEHKLIDGILGSLKKSGESRVQG